MIDTRRVPLRRVTILCHVIPHPPNFGGAIDLRNVIRGFGALGVGVQLVCWHGRSRLPANTVEGLLEIASEVVEVPRRDGWWRALFLTLPPRALSMKPSSAEYRRLRGRVEAFGPEWIVLDNWKAALTAEALRRDLGLPVLYRSHNVEFQYYRELSGVARGMPGFKFWANATRLFPFEQRVRRSADLVADISAEDREQWARLGAAGAGRVLPPVWLDTVPPDPPGGAHDIDLLFVGNLRSANNVEGLEWFLHKVLPIVRERHGGEGLRIVFAGSDPSPALLAECARLAVTCVANPVEVGSLYARARAVINPVRRGSGVSIKMIEAFAAGAHVLATVAALRGLPASLRAAFPLAGDDAGAFAGAVLDSLSSGRVPLTPAERSRVLESELGIGHLQQLAEEMDRVGSGRARGG